MAANLYYTPSTYSSSTTGTFSFWIKRGKLSSEGNTVIWSNTSTNDNNRTYFSINSDDKIRVSVQYSLADREAFSGIPVNVDAMINICCLGCL